MHLKFVGQNAPQISRPGCTLQRTTTRQFRDEVMRDEDTEEYRVFHARGDHMYGRQRDLQGIAATMAIDPESVIITHALATENFQLKNEIKKLKGHLTNSKLETAELYNKFGSLADEWQKTVTELKETCQNQEANYEERITALEGTNEKLRKENAELRAMVKELYEKEAASKDQERQLKIGQIGFALERLVGQIIFPGTTKSERRQRYGLQLKDIYSKVSKLTDDNLKRNAMERLENIPQEIFEDWVVGIIDEIKKMRLPHAHPKLGDYEEVVSEIRVHYKDDDDRCDDLITIVGYLKNLCEKEGLPFGEAELTG